MTDKSLGQLLNELNGRRIEGGAVEAARKIVEDAPGTPLQKSIIQMGAMIVRMGHLRQMSPACAALLEISMFTVMAEAKITDEIAQEISHALDLASDYVHSEAQKRGMR